MEPRRHGLMHQKIEDMKSWFCHPSCPFWQIRAPPIDNGPVAVNPHETYVTGVAWFMRRYSNQSNHQQQENKKTKEKKNGK